MITSVVVDDMGPEKIIQIYNPANNSSCFVVVDNTVKGPAICEVRTVTPIVTIGEVAKIARKMTLKSAMADLPYGGMAVGKSRNVECPIHDIVDKYILYDDNMDKYVSYGLLQAMKTMLSYFPEDERCLESKTVIVEGYDQVGKGIVEFLYEERAIIIGVSDEKCAIYNIKHGFNVQKLNIAKSKGTVGNYPRCSFYPHENLLEIPCDILILTTPYSNIITTDNANKINTKILLQGADHSISNSAEKYLEEHGVINVPDFVVNAGGVIATAVKKDVYKTVKNIITKNVNLILTKSMNARDISMQIARERIGVKTNDTKK